MSDYVPDRASLDAALTHHDDSRLIDLLSQLGDDRARQEAVGGPLWAEFTDWCWAQPCPVDPDLFETWLSEVRAGPVSQAHLTKAHTHLATLVTR